MVINIYYCESSYCSNYKLYSCLYMSIFLRYVVFTEEQGLPHRYSSVACGTCNYKELTK